MSADFYSKLAATATRLIKKFGAPVTLPRETGGSSDPVTGEETAGVDATVTTTGVMLNYDAKLIDGVNILASDRVLVLTNEQEITIDDTPIFGSESDPWTIVGINEKSPVGTALVYFVQVRK